MRITSYGNTIPSVSTVIHTSSPMTELFQHSTVHLFIHDQSFYERLSKCASHIVTLSIINDVRLHDASKIDGLEKFAIKSTAGSGCSFGIETNALFARRTGDSVLNTKKLDKLENDLEKLLKTVSHEGYIKSASPKIQAKHNDKVSHVEQLPFSFIRI